MVSGAQACPPTTMHGPQAAAASSATDRIAACHSSRSSLCLSLSSRLSRSGAGASAVAWGRVWARTGRRLPGLDTHCPVHRVEDAVQAVLIVFKCSDSGEAAAIGREDVCQPAWSPPPACSHSVQAHWASATRNGPVGVSSAISELAEPPLALEGTQLAVCRSFRAPPRPCPVAAAPWQLGAAAAWQQV